MGGAGAGPLPCGKVQAARGRKKTRSKNFIWQRERTLIGGLKKRKSQQIAGTCSKWSDCAAMKTSHFTLFTLMLLSPLAIADDGKKERAASEASYLEEANLPKGWPAPGPYDVVTQKDYPIYRAAYTAGNGQNRAFWTLFRHIQSKDIPMTSPVEMEVQQKDGKMEMTTMGFLYQNPEVGTKGPDGDKVQVTDVAPMKVLSYAWMGPNNEANTKVAKAALDAEIAAKKLTTKGFRILGYNGPSVPRAKRTFEMQAILAE